MNRQATIQISVSPARAGQFNSKQEHTALKKTIKTNQPQQQKNNPNPKKPINDQPVFCY